MIVPPCPLPVRVPPRYLRVLRWLFEAHPLPVPTITVVKACFCTEVGSDATALKRGWRGLDRMRELEVVGATTAPHLTGRPPAYWHLTAKGLEVLKAAGLVTAEELKSKPKQHKAYRQLLKREHDLHVLSVKAELQWLAAKDARITIEQLVHDRSTWRSVTLPGGAGEVAPDLVAVLQVAGVRLCLLAEVQGTASPLSAVQEKLRAYKSYMAQGLLQRDYATRNVRILFITFSPDPKGGVDHRNNLIEVVAEEGGVDRLCLVATINDVTAQGIAAPVWLRPLEYKTWLSSLHPVLRADFIEVRHAGNARRWQRDEQVQKHVGKVGLLG